MYPSLLDLWEHAETLSQRLYSFVAVRRKEGNAVDQLYVFIESSFLFAQGYKHVKNALGLQPTQKPWVEYAALRRFIERSGEIKRLVLVGSDLPGTLIFECQVAGFNVQTLPRYPGSRRGRKRERGIDQRICWEVAKTVLESQNGAGDRRVVLCTGDKDFMAILPEIRSRHWPIELWVWKDTFSDHYLLQMQVFGKVRVLDREWRKFIRLRDTKPRRTTSLSPHKRSDSNASPKLAA